MRNFFIFSVFLIFSTSLVHAQTGFDCGDMPPSCDIDDIDGFNGTNATAAGSSGGAVCPSNGGGQIHNALWFSFLAGNTDLTIRYALSNCMEGNDGCTGDGVQIAVWEGCEGSGGTCVGGDGACIDPVANPADAVGSIDLTGLVPGLTYNLVMDGCCGATCVIDLEIIVGAWEFDVPDLDDVDLETNIDARGTTAIDLDNFIFCPGHEIIFTATGDNGNINLSQVEGLWEWSVNGPAPAEWTTSNGEGGTDFDITYGDVDATNNPGGNIISMIFDAEGTYEICLEDYSTFCSNADGNPPCQEITITEIQPQDFGVFDLCRINFVDNRDRFFPPDFEDEDGNFFEWNGGDEIVFDDVPTPTGGQLFSSFEFGQGPCEVEQVITINIVGDTPIAEEIVSLYDCQIPYELDVLGTTLVIDDIDDFTGEVIELENVGPDENYEGELCPALVNITAERIELLDSIIVECLPTGLNVTGVLFREDGNFFDYDPLLWIWRDSVDVAMGKDSIIASTNPAILEAGTYFLEYGGEVLDEFTEDFLPCGGTIGPFQVQGTGDATNPVALPYDQNRCPDELDNIQVGVDLDPNATYLWNIPAGFQANSALTANTLNVSILDPNATGLLSLTVSGGCSPVTVDFPFIVADLPVVNISSPTDECEGTEAIFQFNGNQADIASYEWDFGTGTVSSGSLTSPTVGITFPASAAGTSVNYSLTVVSQAGCTNTQSFSIPINAGLENPQVTCDAANTNSTQIVFTWPDVVGNSGYNVDDINIPAGATGVLNGTTYTITGVSAGDIAQIQVNVEGSPCGNPSAQMTCNASSCSPPAATIGNFSQVDLCDGDPANTTIQFTAQAPPGFTGTYSGNGVTPTGAFDPADPAVTIGTNTITYSYVDDTDPACSNSITADVIVSEFPIISVNVPTDECAGTEAMFQFTGNQGDIASYSWVFSAGNVTTGTLTSPNVGVTFPAGTQSVNYSLTVISQGGCESTESLTITINESLENPQVTCDNVNTNSTQIVFTWIDVTGNTGYTVDDINIPAGATGTLNGTTYTVTGISAGDVAQIQVNVLGSQCGTPSTMMTCNASNCSPPAPTIGNFSQVDLCQDDPTNTTIQFTAEAPAGFTGTYSGNGVTPMGLFDPADPTVVIGTNTITFSYVDDADPNCSTSVTADVIVGDAPSPDFTIDVTDVCEGEEFTITGPNANANPIWDFGGGVGDENGLTFNASGPQVVSVTVTSASSCSAELSVDIDVIPRLEDINVTCVGTPSDVTFTWNEISNADRYELVYTAPDGSTSNSNLDVNVTTFTTPPLNENDVVSLVVTAVNNNTNCSSVSDNATCMAIACDIPVVELNSGTGQVEFCSNDLLSPINLIVMVDGAAPAPGSIQFSGTGVSQVGDNGVFDPDQAPGTTTVFLDYTDPNTGCPGNATLDFQVLTVERPALTPDRDIICIGETVIIDHDGTPPQGTDAWVIPAGASVDILTDNTRELSWDVPGLYTVMHTYMNGNCTPETAEVTIEVVLGSDTPIVICESTGPDFIRFGWSDQTQFMFEVFIDGVTQGIQSESEFTAMNLSEGDEVEIVVVVIDPNCGDKTSDSMICFASLCNVVWEVTSVPDMVCRADGNPPIELEVSAFDPFDPTVVIDAEWLNPEVNGNLFTPPVGTGSFTLMARYTNGSCIRDTSFVVEIFEVPEFVLSVSPDPICVNEAAVLSYDYTLVANEQLIWDFGVGTEGNAGVGTQEVSFDADDLYTISLIIDNNGCASDIVTVDLEVQPELIEPDIRCGTSTITTVDIEWDAVFCADMYNVSVDGALVATVPQTSYTVENLTSEQTVDITIEAISSCACGNISFSMTCTTDPCPDEMFTFTGFTAGVPICIDANASLLTVTATPTTLLGTGTGTWIPTSFLDADGVINPELATSGTFEIEYNYSEDVCNYTTSTMITFVDAPTINILNVRDPACPDDLQGSISIEGLNGQAPYMFSIDGGALQASGEFMNVNIGDHTLQVVDDNGCIFDGGIATVDNPITPTIRVSGDNSIILGDNGFYELDLGSIDQSQISDILWLNNGVPVCDDITCLTYTFSNAEVDAEIQVIVTYNGGCEVASNVFLADVVRIQDFYVPNVFSPNGVQNPVDQQWSLFIEGDEVFPRSINVYNRWGNLVHSEEWAFDENNLPPNDGQGLLLWDGFFGETGPPIVAGVYAYVLQIEVSGVLRNVGGDLTIIR